MLHYFILMIIKKCKGCLFLNIDTIDNIFLEKVPNEFKINQEKRDNNKYHITIINSNEIENLTFEEIDKDISYLILGLSFLQKDKNEIYYLNIYSHDLNKIRKEYNLEPINFHITLGFKFALLPDIGVTI